MDRLRDAYEFVNRTQVLGMELGRLLLAFLFILIAVTFRKFFTTVVIGRVSSWARRTGTVVDDVVVQTLQGPVAFAILLAGLFGAFVALDLPTEPTNVRVLFFFVLRILVAIDVAWLFFRLIDALSVYMHGVAGKTATRLDDQLIPLLRKSLKIFVSLVTSVFVIQNLGYSVSSLLAGLGIGGLALALAAQQTLSNLFGSITILIDRPFTVGDWIEGSDFEGVVEEIGLRSTRIRTFGKTQVSIPNSVLANSIVNNWSRMPIRRVKMTVGVTYDTNADQMDAAVEGIRTLLRQHPGVHQDFFLVYFTDFGGSSLDIFVYYFTSSTVWAEFLAVRQEINLQIMRLLESQGLEIAFPTRTVHLKQDDESDPKTQGTKR